MAANQFPKPNTWYVNHTGKLIKARMVCYSKGEPNSLLIEYLEGSVHIVSIEDWYKLDLSIHSWLPTRNRAKLSQ